MSYLSLVERTRFEDWYQREFLASPYTEYSNEYTPTAAVAATAWAAATPDGTKQLQARIDELENICAEAYQVVGNLLSDVDAFDTDSAEKILDNLSQLKLVHNDVLPWPSFKRN